MTSVAYLPIVADRYGPLVRHLYVAGLDLTGVTMRAQVRFSGDSPGEPYVDLLTVTNGNAEGLRLVDVTTDAQGLPTSHIEIVINETTMEALPYAGELGDAVQFAWDMQITLAGRKRRLAKGEFEITGDGVTGADAAPINRPIGYGRPVQPITSPWKAARLAFGEEQVTVQIVDAELVAPLAKKASDAADKAASASVSSSDAAAEALLAKDQAADLVRPENIFINVPLATAEDAVADGTTFKVVSTSTGDAAVYRKPSGGQPLYREATRESLAAASGASLIGTKLPYDGSIARTQAERNTDEVCVLDFIPRELHAAIVSGTDETDLSLYGQKALSTGKTVFFPAGRYHGHFDLPSGTKLIGEGRERTVLRNFGDAPVLTIDNTSDNRCGVQVEGMTIRNRNKALYQQADGILINGARGSGENDCHIFFDLLIFQFRYNVHMKGRSIWNRWVRCSFVEAILDNFFADAYDNQAIQTFDTCRWAAAGRYGLRVVHTFEQFLLNGWTFINCNFENNLWVPIRVGGTYGLQGWTFIGCYSEENTNSIPPGTTDGVVKCGMIMVDCPYAIGLVVINCVFANNTPPHANPDYYIYISDACTNVVGSVSSCRGGAAGVISVYWKRGLDFGLNFGLTVNLDRAGGSRSALDSVLASDFVPSIHFSGTTAGVVYSNRRGRYVINGSLLTFQAYIALASKGTSSGEVRLAGLPFSGQSIDNLMQTVSVAISESFNTKTDVHGQLIAGSPEIQVQATSSGVIVPLTDADLGNFTTFRISGSYLI